VAQYKQWDFQLVDARTKRAITAAAVAVVLTAGTPDVLTLVSDQQGTSQSQPVSMTNGQLTFYTAKSVTSLDLSILDANGNAIYATGLANSVHRLDVFPEQRHQMLVFPMVFNSGGTVTDTGFDLPINLLVKDAFVRVTTVDATETVDMGLLASETGGDEDGFLKALSVATAGFVNAYPTVTNGSNIDYHDTTAVYGVLLAQLITGADAVATVGGFERRYYRTDGVAKSVTYTPSSSDTFKGFGYLEYFRLV
jgi:hypothetical protein